MTNPLPNDLSAILDDCLNRLPTEGIEACLRHYPAQAAELRPLLTMALQVRASQQAASMAVATRARIRQRVLTGAAAAERPASPFGFLARLRLNSVFSRMALASLLLLVMVVGSVAASAYASPGDLLYPVKRGAEGLRLGFAADDNARANLHLQFADNRLNEIERAAQKGNQVEGDLLANLDQNVSTAATLIEQSQLAALTPRLLTVADREQQVLAAVKDKVAAGAKATYDQVASNNSRLLQIAIALKNHEPVPSDPMVISERRTPEPTHILPTAVATQQGEPTHAATRTHEPEPTHILPPPLPSREASRTPRPEPSHEATRTHEPEPTRAATRTHEPEPTHEATRTHQPEPTHEATRTHEPEPTHEATRTHEPEPTHPATWTPNPTLTPRPEPTHAPTFTHEPEPTHAATLTPRPEPTHAATFTHEPEPTHAATLTPRPEPTHEPTRTHEPEPTHEPTLTPRPEPTHAATFTPLPEPTHEATRTHEPEPTHEPTLTPRPEPTHAATFTPLPEPTHEPTQTHEPEPTHTATLTPRPTETPRSTETPHSEPTATPQPTATPRPTETPHI